MSYLDSLISCLTGSNVTPEQLDDISRLIYNYPRKKVYRLWILSSIAQKLLIKRQKVLYLCTSLHSQSAYPFDLGTLGMRKFDVFHDKQAPRNYLSLISPEGSSFVTILAMHGSQAYRIVREVKKKNSPFSYMLTTLWQINECFHSI